MDLTAKLSPTNGNSGPVAQAVDDASTSAHGAIDKVSATAKPAVDRMASGAHQAVDKIAIAASSAAESLGATAGQLKDAQARMAAECRGYVRENPLASLGIAAAVGFVLSRLLSRR